MGRRRAYDKLFSFTYDSVTHTVRLETISKLLHLGQLEEEFWQAATQRHRLKGIADVIKPLQIYFLLTIRSDRIVEYWKRIRHNIKFGVPLRLYLDITTNIGRILTTTLDYGNCLHQLANDCKLSVPHDEQPTERD